MRPDDCRLAVPQHVVSRRKNPDVCKDLVFAAVIEPIVEVPVLIALAGLDAETGLIMALSTCRSVRLWCMNAARSGLGPQSPRPPSIMGDEEGSNGRTESEPSQP